MNNERTIYATRGIKIKPFGLKAMSKLVGKRVPFWDAWHEIRYEMGGSYDHGVALERNGETALLSQPYQLRDEKKLRAFCKKYGLSYVVGKMPREYCHPDVITILIYRGPMSWASWMS